MAYFDACSKAAGVSVGVCEDCIVCDCTALLLTSPTVGKGSELMLVGGMIST